jgi:3-dehydroquinate dehydratase II
MARIPTKLPATTVAETIYVLNGPVLGSLGSHESGTRSQADLASVEELCTQAASKFGLRADCKQFCGESELIEFIHEARANKAAGIVVNAGGYSHTSIALREALTAVKIPAIELHLDNAHAHDNFRRHVFSAKAACATLSGFGIDGYRLAINGLAARIGVAATA